MKIARIDTFTQRVPLTRPYAIASGAGASTDAVDILVVRIEASDGTVGLGSASPVPEITGETLAACAHALAAPQTQWLLQRDVADYAELGQMAIAQAPGAPGASAALDMALHDLQARCLGLPLVEMLGRKHDVLPTSITIGIKSLDETLAEADEYLARGFRCLKVKIGQAIDADILRLVRLRERVSDRITIRVDANQGYDAVALQQLLHDCRDLDLELIEQPLPRGGDAALRQLPLASRHLMAADESVMSPADAVAHATSPKGYGTFVIKLMKCGGITSAQAIAATAAQAKLYLMWGCMDESVIGISAALHTAFACEQTRYLDLDGSLDLLEDVANGGFELQDGMMRTLDRPGLGADLRDDLHTPT